MDFWRPLYSKFAFADGHYSIECYLDALSAARSDAVGDAASLLGQLGASLYHVPFVRMAFKAHQREFEIERGSAVEPDDEAARAALKESFDRLTAPWLQLNAEVGNIYTGSLFLSLIDLLRRAADDLTGNDVALFSYGSGCGATYCVGRVVDGAGRWSGALDPADRLAARRRLEIDDYERLTAEAEQADTAERLDPERYGLETGLFYTGTRDHQRRYERL
jgi:hydroxymethylglutaryl-CoA synthase